MKFKTAKNIYKKFFQFGILLLLGVLAIKTLLNIGSSPDFEAYCPFGGLQALGSYLVKGSLACTMSGTQIGMGLILITFVVVFGKLFCGYLCPIGTISEKLGQIGERLKIRYSVEGKADLVLRSLKYIILFITFYFTLQSSELFCKMFDPYYALTSGFNPDVSVVLALVAILVVIIGSIFIRLFWCKYLCPLGAVSNIFKFYWMFLAVIGIYLLLIFSGLSISYVYPLAAISLLGFILEIALLKKVKFAPVTIIRNTESCINCNLCSKTCPQHIAVAKMEKVTHIDCNLCGDCLHVCPEKDTLQLNRRNIKWLPAAVLTFAIILGLILAQTWEIPTINETWGTPEQLQNAATYSQSGLKNIKCYGSSKSFASKMQRIRGVYGVSTYVNSHSVKILFDPNLISQKQIQEKIFTPVKKEIDPLTDDIKFINEFTFSVDQLFDPMDASYLEQLLVQNTGACGYITEYGCPVIVHIFFPQEDNTTVQELANLIESKELTYGVAGNENTVKLHFKITDQPQQAKVIKTVQFKQLMYSPIVMYFNGFETFSDSILRLSELPIPSNSNHRKLSFLVSHLSANNGVVAFKSMLDSTGVEIGNIIYVDTMTNLQVIYNQLIVDTLDVSYSNGTTSRELNTFDFNSVVLTEKLFTKNQTESY